MITSAGEQAWCRSGGQRHIPPNKSVVLIIWRDSSAFRWKSLLFRSGNHNISRYIEPKVIESYTGSVGNVADDYLRNVVESPEIDPYSCSAISAGDKARMKRS